MSTQLEKLLAQQVKTKQKLHKAEMDNKRIHNEKELRQLLEQSAEQAIRYNEGQHRQQEQQRQRQQQQKGRL